MAERTCLRCDAPIERPRDSGRWPSYCSAVCRRRQHTETQSAKRKAERKATTFPSRRIGYVTCETCSTLFVTRRQVNPSDRFCRDCQRRRRNEWQRDFLRQYKEEHGEAYTQRYRDKRNAYAKEYNARRLERDGVARSCEFCTGDFLARNESYRFCSKSCKGKATRQNWPASKIRVTACREGCHRLQTQHGDDLQRLWRCEICPVRPMFQAGRCRRCDEFFVMLWNDRPCHYCSDRCQKRDHKSMRRVRKREAFVAPVYRTRIFERDDWRCQICKRKVRRDAVPPHPKAPVLDHITPLADGGTHEPANVQCAHFLCNSMKGDRAADDQLRLIG